MAITASARAGLGQFFRRQRNLKRAGHAHHFDVFRRRARCLQRVQRPGQKPVRNKTIEAADDHGEAEARRVRRRPNLLWC